jgi:hypothetical protein
MANQVQGTADTFSRCRGAKKIPAREEFIQHRAMRV